MTRSLTIDQYFTLPKARRDELEAWSTRHGLKFVYLVEESELVGEVKVSYYLANENGDRYLLPDKSAVATGFSMVFDRSDPFPWESAECHA